MRGYEMEFTKPIAMQRSTHYGNNYFSVYSNKIKRVVHLFSNLEYYNFLTLETNPQVETFCEQPLKLKLYKTIKLNMPYLICGYGILMEERNCRK